MEKTCSICQDDILGDNMKLDCGHSFHVDCVNPWFNGYNTCPTCRSIAKINGEKIGREQICSNVFISLHQVRAWSQQLNN